MPDGHHILVFGDFGWQDRFRPQYEVVSVLVLGPRLATKRAMLKNVVLATSLLQGAATIMWARSSGAKRVRCGNLRHRRRERWCF